MNKNTTLIAVAGVIAIAGQWSRKRTLSPAMIIGLFFVALFIAMLSEIDEQIAFYLSLLVTTTIALTYLPELLTRLGLLSPDKLKQQLNPTFKQQNR